MHASLRFPHYLLMASLVLGICADQLFYGRWLGISVPIFVLLCLAVLGSLSAAERRYPTRANLWLGITALGFALFVMVRAAPLLFALNLLCTLGLLLLFVASYRGEVIARLPGWQYVSQSLTALAELVLRPAPLVVQSSEHIAGTRERMRQFIPVARGVLLALPVLAGFTFLLMSADSVFASYIDDLFSLQLPIDSMAFVQRSIVIVIVAWSCAGGLLVALTRTTPRLSASSVTGELPAEGDTQPLLLPRQSVQLLGNTEAVTVLTLVDMLFGGFIGIQAAYFFGGLDTLNRTGMTYAEYARRGFFELLAVACLTLGMLWMMTIVTRRDQPRQRYAFNATSTMLIVLVLGLLASAFQRMLLYEQAFGYTRLRIYTLSFMIWLAVVLVLFMIALLREKPSLFTFGGFVSALVYLALLNIVNPDAMIVRENVARYQESGKLDADYLTRLSADATPALISALDVVDPEARGILLTDLAYQFGHLQGIEARSGWAGWHLARAQARWAMEDVDAIALAQPTLSESDRASR